jgi:hypothetical protein
MRTWREPLLYLRLRLPAFVRWPQANAPITTLSDIVDYEQAAGRVIHFLLHPNEYAFDRDP